MRHLNEQGGDAVFSEAHAKELLNVQSNYNKKLQELNNQLAKQKSDLAVKYMKMAQQQQAATAAKAANTPTPTTSTTSTKQTGTVTTAGQPVNAQGNPPAVESINILRVKELNENKGVKLSKKWTDGFKEQADMFEPFEIIDYKVDPGYGYQDVAMFLIKFEDGEYGLCIWDSNRKRFVEEPATLNDYGFDNPEKLYYKTGFRLEELDESLNEDEERYTNPTYMGDKRNWYQKPESQVGYKTPRKKRKNWHKPWTDVVLNKYYNLIDEIEGLKSDLRDYDELFAEPEINGGELEDFFGEIGDEAAEILNSGIKDKLKALKNAGVDNPKNVLDTYYYYYPVYNPKLDSERKEAKRQIPKIKAKIEKLQAKLDNMEDLYESVNESNTWNGYSTNDLEKEKEKYKRGLAYLKDRLTTMGDYPERDEERYTNPTYMGDKRNWYQKPESQVGYKTPRKPSKKRYKPWNFDTLGKYADIKGEIDDLKSELRDYNELFSAPDVYGGEVEEFFAEIGDKAAEILNSGAYKNDKEKLKALESIGVDNPKSILRTYYYYYPAFNPELDKERKQAEREIPKIQAKIKKLKAKLDKMDSIHESVNESDNSWEGYSSMDLEKEKEKYKRAISYYQNLFRSKGDYPERDEDKEEYKEVKQEYKELLAYMRSLKESSYRLDNVSTEDLQATKDYMDAENISYAEDEDGSTINFDEDDFDEEMRDDLDNMGFEKDEDDILSIEDEDDQIQGEEDEDFVDMDEKIDEEKVFYVKVNDDGSEFTGKIYKLFDNGEWRAKVVDGESETFEKLNFDPEYDEIDVISFLRENYDDAELISEDEFNGHVENPEEEPTIESYHKIPTLDEFINESSKEEIRIDTRKTKPSANLENFYKLVRSKGYKWNQYSVDFALVSSDILYDEEIMKKLNNMGWKIIR